MISEAYKRGRQSVIEALSEALVSDGECGVHWMANEKADRFKQEYPEFCKIFNEISKEFDEV